MNSLTKEVDIRLGSALVENEIKQRRLLVTLNQQLLELKAQGFHDDLGTSSGVTTQLALKVRQLGGGKLPGKYTIEQLRQSPEWNEIIMQLEASERTAVHGVLGRITGRNREFCQLRSRLELRNFNLITVPVSAPPDKKLRDLRKMDMNDLLNLGGVKLASAIFVYLAFHR